VFGETRGCGADRPLIIDPHYIHFTTIRRGKYEVMAPGLAADVMDLSVWPVPEYVYTDHNSI
jgi:hypothetical protein